MDAGNVLEFEQLRELLGLYVRTPLGRKELRPFLLSSL